MFNKQSIFCSTIFCLSMFLTLGGCQAVKSPVATSNLSEPPDNGTINYNVPKGIDLTDIISGKYDSTNSELVSGELSIPKITSSEKIPAVVIMHASGGVFPWREKEIARYLNKYDIATFIPYSFKSRGVSGTNKTMGTGISFGMRMADAYEAFKLLATHPSIDPNRIGIMGYSSGGIVSMLAMDKKIKDSILGDQPGFKAHVNVFASVLMQYENPDPTPAKMLFLSGEKDDICPIESIEAYVNKLKSAGSIVELTVYRDAYHSFDAKGDVRILADYPNDAECTFLIKDDGSFVSETTGDRFSEREWEKHIGPCSTKGVTFGRNSHAAKQYIEDAIMFFNRNL